MPHWQPWPFAAPYPGKSKKMQIAVDGIGAGMELAEGMNGEFSNSSLGQYVGTMTSGDSGANATDEDLFAFGGNPSGSQPFPRGPRAGTDIEVKNGMVSGQWPPDLQGASTYIDPTRAPLTGHYYRLPAGTLLPVGFDIFADGADVGGTMPWGHRTVYPIVDMPFDDFVSDFRKLGWQYGGKR